MAGEGDKRVGYHGAHRPIASVETWRKISTPGQYALFQTLSSFTVASMSISSSEKINVVP